MKVSKRGSACLSMLLILASIILYLALVLPILYRPLIGDDVLNTVYFQAPKVEFSSLMGWGHPPLYYDMMRIFVHLIGITNENLRIFGIICFIIAIALINLIAKEITQESKVGLLASILYSLHPLAIQGSLVLDIDNTVLTVILLVSIFYFLKTYEKPSLRSIFFLGVLFFLGLWAKLSTPNLLVISMFISYLFRGRIKKGIVDISIVAGLGVSLFFFAWFTYSWVYKINFFEIFKRSLIVLSMYTGGPTFSGLKELGLRFTRTYLWLGPYFFISWALIVILRIREYLMGKREFRRLDFLILYTSVLFFAYIIIGGASLGFAKYHYPVVSIACIIISEFILGLRPFKFKKIAFGDNSIRFSVVRKVFYTFLYHKKRIALYLVLGLTFIFLDWIRVGDLLYAVNYTLRKVIIFMPQEFNSFFADFLKRIVIYHLPLIIGLICFYLLDKRKEMMKNSVLLLSSLIFISNLSLDIRQINADYSTALCYGRSISEFRRLAGLVKEIHRNNPRATIIAPEDIMVKAVGQWYPGYTYGIFRNNRQRFLEAIKEDKVYCVVYAFTWNAVYTFREVFFHPAVRKVLDEKYRLYPLGEYSVYLKKK